MKGIIRTSTILFFALSTTAALASNIVVTVTGSEPNHEGKVSQITVNDSDGMFHPAVQSLPATGMIFTNFSIYKAGPDNSFPPLTFKYTVSPAKNFPFRVVYTACDNPVVVNPPVFMLQAGQSYTLQTVYQKSCVQQGNLQSYTGSIELLPAPGFFPYYPDGTYTITFTPQ